MTHSAEFLSTVPSLMLQVLRRMVFVNNRNLIQSEAVLAAPLPAAEPQPPPKAGGGKQGGRKGGRNGGKGAKRQPAAAQLEQPPPAADTAVHTAADADGGAAAEAAKSATGPAVDHGQLPCEYHQAIVAGLSLASAHTSCHM